MMTTMVLLGIAGGRAFILTLLQDDLPPGGFANAPRHRFIELEPPTVSEVYQN